MSKIYLNLSANANNHTKKNRKKRKEGENWH